MFNQRYKSLFDLRGKTKWKAADEFYSEALAIVTPAPGICEDERFARLRFVAERAWHAGRRPYYLVYPAIADALVSANYNGVSLAGLRIPCQPVELRLAKPIEGVSALLVYVGDTAVPYYFFVKKDGNDFFCTGGHGDISDSPLNQLVIGVALLAQDTDWLVPEPLAKDLRKYEESGDARLIQRAHNRGKICFSLGKAVEKAAHIRRPHFAVRWMRPNNARKYIGHKATGKELLPVLRPIKGSVVQRERVKQVPTGWRDSTGTTAL
jgi:hypothetical protein